MNQLIDLTISNFRGIAAFHATPNGKSMELRGKNGAGKTNAVDALWWALGGSLDGEVVANGKADAKVQVIIGDYAVTRKQVKDKRPTLTVKSKDGKLSFNSPTALLSGFLDAIERQTFSTRKAKDQAAVLRELCPEIDTAKLDAEYKAIYDQRTEINRDAKALSAQAEGIVIPDAPATVADDVDTVAITKKLAEVEKVKAENVRIARERVAAGDAASKADQRRAKAIIELREAEAACKEADANLETMRQACASRPEINTAEIEAEIATAQRENAKRAIQRNLLRDANNAKARRAEMEEAAQEKKDEAERLTESLAKIEQTKTSQLQAAKLPIPGLAITADAVTLDQHGAPVEISALNTATRIRLDVAIAAALGHRLVAVRDASLLDDDSRAAMNAFAAEHGVQLITEIVCAGESLHAEIVEAEAVTA